MTATGSFASSSAAEKERQERTLYESRYQLQVHKNDKARGQIRRTIRLTYTDALITAQFSIHCFKGFHKRFNVCLFFAYSSNVKLGLSKFTKMLF